MPAARRSFVRRQALRLEADLTSVFSAAPRGCSTIVVDAAKAKQTKAPVLASSGEGSGKALPPLELGASGC